MAISNTNLNLELIVRKLYQTIFTEPEFKFGEIVSYPIDNAYKVVLEKTKATVYLFDRVVKTFRGEKVSKVYAESKALYQQLREDLKNIKCLSDYHKTSSGRIAGALRTQSGDEDSHYISRMRRPNFRKMTDHIGI